MITQLVQWRRLSDGTELAVETVLQTYPKKELWVDYVPTKIHMVKS